MNSTKSNLGISSHAVHRKLQAIETWWIKFQAKRVRERLTIFYPPPDDVRYKLDNYYLELFKKLSDLFIRTGSKNVAAHF